MSRFSTGNVVKLNSGSVVIITRVNKDSIDWISFDYTNSSGATKLVTGPESRPCSCYELNFCQIDEDCEDCKGTGSRKVEITGMDKAEILGFTVKEYVIKSLTKNFNF